jgi:hypothetical protein
MIRLRAIKNPDRWQRSKSWRAGVKKKTMNASQSGQHVLYWRDQLVGVVTDVGYVDFPWAGGTIALGELSGEVRAVLEYIDRESKTEDGVQDWPFSDEMVDGWRIVKPDGTEVDILPPVVDFDDNSVSWR